MLTKQNRIRRALLIVGSLALIGAGAVVTHQATATTAAEPPLGTAQLPAAVAGHPSAHPVAVTRRVLGAPSTSVHAPRPSHIYRAYTSPGVPVAIDIPIPSLHYPHGVRARISSHPLNQDHSLYVPADPHEVSWANQDAAPGGDRGTIILTSHINFVIGGQTVIGAFADLAAYAKASVGRTLMLRLADGRHLRYRIVTGREYTKEQLAADPALRANLYDQTGTYGRRPGRPSGRLLLVSCGGPFDPASGEYEDNVFLFALPLTASRG